MHAALVPAAVPSPQASVTLPARGAFYYPWYPETWTVNRQHVFFHPTLGYYDSDSTSVADAHIQALDYGLIEVAIASWWGIDHHNESVRLPLLLDRTAALGSPLAWTIYYEKEGSGDPTLGELQTDLAYLDSNYATRPGWARVDGKPVIFVYGVGETCTTASRWKQATEDAWYVVLKVFSGHLSCADQPQGWHQYGPGHDESPQSGQSFSISPGYWHVGEPEPRLARDLTRWQQNIRNMIASQAPWQLITTFNEWGEGTAVEEADEWTSSGYGDYLDALHNNGGSPTAVAFKAASAVRTRTSVLIRWSTASEAHLLGFNVYRERNGKRVRLNRAVIPSVFAGTRAGHSYSSLDRGVSSKSVLRYWLQAVSTGGTRSWDGPIVAR